MQFPGRLTIRGEIGALTGTIDSDDGSIEASIIHSGSRLLIGFPGDSFGAPGMFRMNLTFQGDTGSGTGSSPMGDFSVTMTRAEAFGDTPGGAR
jgi:hypothetical protein